MIPPSIRRKRRRTTLTTAALVTAFAGLIVAGVTVPWWRGVAVGRVVLVEVR